MNTELMLVLPYCNKDIELLTKCVKWMLELQDRTGKYHPHHCMLVSDSEVPNDKRLELQSIMKPHFVTVTTMIVRISPDKQKWPTAPNLMFYFTARQMEEAYKLPWLWFEPDAVPLKAGWLDAIALAYAQSPKRFLGSHVPANNQPDMPPIHLAGCAVYPANAYTGINSFASSDKAFDIVSAPYTVPRSDNTPLMQHFWGADLNSPPVFRETADMMDPKNQVTLALIDSRAVMFHRCKDGSLIDLLRKRAKPSSAKSKTPASDDSTS